MKKFLIRATLFTLILLLLILPLNEFVNKKVYEIEGPNYTEQIDKSFEDVLKDNYDIIMLGNSRIYRGINPEKLDAKAYNFAHDNDSFNQIYYKLLYLKDNNNLPKEIVLGVDYFQFSVFSETRNDAYKGYFHEEYMKDYDKKSFDIDEKFNDYMTVIQNRINICLDYLQKIGAYKADGEYDAEKVPYMTDGGQYIRYGEAEEDDKLNKPRESTVLPVQEEYFDKILEFCEKNNIKVYMLMMPLRDVELAYYEEGTVEAFDEMFDSKENENVVYLNYGKDDRFSIKDFQDVTHLNIDGADKFSEILNRNLK